MYAWLNNYVMNVIVAPLSTHILGLTASFTTKISRHVEENCCLLFFLVNQNEYRPLVNSAIFSFILFFSFRLFS